MKKPIERVKEIIDYKGLSISAFERNTGLSNNSIQVAIKRNTNLKDETLNSILNTYSEISAEWLLTGKGDMIASKSGHGNKVLVSEGKGVPYYENIEATGSVLGVYQDHAEEPSFFINYQHFDDCTAYLPIAGDSMYPRYCSGEIVALKRIFNFDIILWGEAHLVVTDSEANDLRTIKLIFQHEEDDKVILRASNPNFKGDITVPKRNILSLFLVKGKITRNQL